jgi:FkbM family methyltransferase
MKSIIKLVAVSLISFLVGRGSNNRIGRYLLNQILFSAMERVHEVSHGGVKLKFAVPNPLCEWRAKTFSTKEPETLEWIEKIPEHSIFWDVGANVGLYSVYAAKKRNCLVYSFEPSVFNLELLARNLFINGLTEQVCIVPLALSDRLGSSQMRMTTTEWGGALSTFGRDFGWDGEKIRQIFEFQTVGISMEDAVKRLDIPSPDYIKMDVDGLEHFILQGGGSILRSIRGILIEVNDDFQVQADRCQKLLKDAGLVMLEKRHSELIENSTTGFKNCYDQIWGRI